MKYKLENRYSDSEEYSDIELYRKLKGGGEEANKALEILYERCSPRIYSYCRKIMMNSPSTDDVFQETFLKFYQMGISGQEVQNVKAYLLRIARNLCLNEKNKKSNRDRITPEEFHFPSLDVPYEQKELTRLINDAMEKLPEDYRESLILREVHGHSYNEIAEILNTTMPIVRIRIYRAKIKVRTMLEPFIKDVNKFQKEEYEEGK